MKRQADDAFIQQLSVGANIATTNDKAGVSKPGTLTTRQGHPVTSNQSTRTVGNRGPATLEN